MWERNHSNNDNNFNRVLESAVGQPWQLAQHETHKRQAHDVFLHPLCHFFLLSRSVDAQQRDALWITDGSTSEYLWDSLLKMKKSKQKNKKNLKLRGIMLLNSALSSSDSLRFPISILFFHFMILLFFNYDDYDRKYFIRSLNNKLM